VTIDSGYDETPFDLGSAAVWRSHVEIFRTHLHRLPAVDLLVGSEDYGDELAARLGVRHHLVDVRRSAVTTSASDIRADVVGNWHMLGAGGRGWVAEHLQVAWWPSVDRDALGQLEKRVWRKLDPTLNLSGMSKTPVRSRISQLRRGLYNEPDPGAEDG